MDKNGSLLLRIKNIIFRTVSNRVGMVKLIAYSYV